MEQDDLKKIEIKEHILVHCSDKAKNEKGIIEIPEDVTYIAQNAFRDIYDDLTLSIHSYSIVPSLLRSLVGRKFGKVKIYDPYFYRTISIVSLAMLFEIYPTAFEASQDGICLFDNIVDSNNNLVFRLLDDQQNIALALAGSSDVEEIPYSVSVEGTTYSVDAFVKLNPIFGRHSFTDDSSSIVIPSISTVIFDGGCRLTNLTFTGPLPKNIYLGKDIKVNDLYINEPKNDVMRHPAYASLRSAVEGSVFYAAPSLCDEESINPGYIRLTERPILKHKYTEEEDKIIEINTFFIASLEPYKIDCYSPVVGTHLRLAIDDKFDRKYDYLVYEPIDVVRTKIRESLDRIDVRYLSFQVDSWNKYKEGE